MQIIELASTSPPSLALSRPAHPRTPGRAVLVTALVALLGSMAAVGSGLGVDIALAQPEKRTVTMGRIGDRWLDTIHFRKIERATRGKTFGYNITYDLTGPDSHVLFWPRDRIDFHGRSPGYRLEVMPLGTGRLWYPDRITATSLPDVHRCILMIEGDYVKQADGAIAAMEGFATVAGLGASVPALRAPIPKPAPRTTLPTLAPRAATPPAAAAGGGRTALAARFGTTAERTAVLERAITAEGGLNTSAKVAGQLAGQRSYIPTQSILDTIGSGVRVADPQGAAGHFMYRSAASFKGSQGTLEVLVHEASGQIRHVLFRSGVAP